MERAALLRGLRRERDQRRYCWQIPFAVLSYAIACSSLVLHLQVEQTYTLESGIVDSIVATTNGALSVVSMATLYDYLRTELIPAAFPDNLEGIPGSLNTYSRILGGIRLAQSRSQNLPCPLAADLAAVSRGVIVRCHPSTTTSASDYGNTALAAAYNVSTAFTPTAASLGTSTSELEPFQLVLSSDAERSDSERLIDGLQASHWIDSATKRVVVEVAILNLEVLSWSRLLASFEFTRGGRVDTTWSIRSVPVDPYLTSVGAALGLFDTLNVLYFVFLFCSLALSTRRKLRESHHLVSLGKGVVSSLTASFDAWWFVDIACAASLLVAFSLWGRTVASLKALQAQISQAHWTPASNALDTLNAHAALENALGCYEEFKVTGFFALFFLTLRLFWQFSLQPRLAVITECVNRSAVDMAHFGFVFFVVMFAYAVWGHLLFGGQMADWNSVWASFFAITKMAMFEHDLATMIQIEPFLGALFFGSFMFIVS